MEQIEECAYHNCGKLLPITEMEMVGRIEGFPQYVCEDCGDKMQNITGFCSISCQLGHGCDESC